MPALKLDPRTEATLLDLAHRASSPRRIALRAAIILHSAEGVRPGEIARRLSISRPTVYLWRRHFLDGGIPALIKDGGTPGRTTALPKEVVDRVVAATRRPPPSGASRWSSRMLGRQVGLSSMTIQRIWRRHGIAPLARE
jgi:transposase